MRIINSYTGSKGSVITKKMMLTSETMIDKEYVEIVNNDFGHYDKFWPGTFGGSSEMDVSLSQTRVGLENIVDNTLVTTGTFHK